jgi:3-oxoacyl-[acyl-carrier-protein] synthase-1
MPACAPLQLSSYTAVSCIGRGLAAIRASLAAGRTGLAPVTFEDVDIDTHVGEVPGLTEPVPLAFAAFDCRNNRLAEAALGQDGFADAVAACVARVSPERVGIFLGTSTSGVLETERAYRRLDPVTGALPASFSYRGTHNVFSVVDYVRGRLGIKGPAAVVSSACSSSAKVFGMAQRMLALKLIDAAVVGGVDSLCLTTLYGFHSLQLVARGPCRPFDVARDGISISEGAAFVLLTRPAAVPDPDAVLLLSVGESSDAHHMSTPHPDGAGAAAAMRQALQDAALTPDDIQYINLHGTGTLGNDSAESRAVTAVLAAGVPASSTKGATGHALGAAGSLEAVICALALTDGLMPGGLNTTQPEPTLTLSYLLENRRAPLSRVMSNSFGFGGSNCCLILGRAASLQHGAG